jgi:hypothetical protein
MKSSMPKRIARRAVATDLPVGERGCLFCLKSDGPFTSEEHVIPRSLGPDTDRFVIPPGVVCDPCNNWLGRQVDGPFVDRFDIKLTRGLERLAGRTGTPPIKIDGRDPVARLDLEIEGAKVEIYAARADETPNGGLDIEVKPVQRDPADVAARTIRSLWKIALGCLWLGRRSEALQPEWDPIRQAVLGTPFKGWLLQAPFTARVTRRLDVRVNFDEPTSPLAMIFVLGGVALAVPLAGGATLEQAEWKARGWDVHRTGVAAPDTVHLRLEPSPADPGIEAARE